MEIKALIRPNRKRGDHAKSTDCSAVVGLLCGCYLALLTPDRFTFYGKFGSLHQLQPLYRVDGKIAEHLFAPLLWVDQQIRPGYWCWMDFPVDYLHPGADGELTVYEYRTNSGFGGRMGVAPAGSGFGGTVGSGPIEPVEEIQVDPHTGKLLAIQWRR